MLEHPLRDAVPCNHCCQFLLACCQNVCKCNRTFCPDCIRDADVHWHDQLTTAEVQLQMDEDDEDGYMLVLLELFDLGGNCIAARTMKLDRTIVETKTVAEWRATLEEELQSDADNVPVSLVITNSEELKDSLRRIMLPPRFLQYCE